MSLPVLASAQIVNIPDPAFKAKLIQAGYDTNNNGYIELVEAQAVTILGVNESGILSLEGIQSFTNLTTLYCQNNHDLSSLDVSNLSNLAYLDTSNCALTSLNVSGCVNLQVLTAWGNQLTTLDISMLGELREFMCDMNDITSISGNGLQNLWKFHISYNPISSVDLSNMPALQFFNCRYTDVSTLDLSVAPTITELMCAGTNITNLDLSVVPNLVSLECEDSPLTALDISNQQLYFLKAYDTDITSIDISNQHQLVEFDVSNTGISELNAVGLDNLRYCHVAGTQLTHLDLTDAPKLFNFTAPKCPLLETVLLKNGNSETLNSAHFANSPNLRYVCCNEIDLAFIQADLLQSGNTTCVLNTYCSFTPGGNYNTITGAVHFDDEGTGCDASDIVPNNVKIAITGATSGVSTVNPAANYAFYTEAGSFTLTPQIENPGWFTSTPPNANVTFADDGNHLNQTDFCITANGVHPDMEVVIVPILVARPGFDAEYTIICRNKGNQALSGSVIFTYEDDVLDFVSSSVAPDVQTMGQLEWNYTGMAPFAVQTYHVTLNVNSPIETPAVNIGDELNFSATVNPVPGDETPMDNTFGLKQTVVGSFDPNDKHCMQGEVVSTTQIGNFLHYVINFENTGNFPAENVVIKDLLDADKFDISSLQVLSSSHAEVPVLTGNKLEFYFEGINLVPNEYGYVAYKIKTKPTLTAGSVVTNKASIYFDFNAPVVTNTATTTFQQLGVPQYGASRLKLFPNPVRDVVHISAESPIRSVSVIDGQGRTVWSDGNRQSSDPGLEYDINLQALSSGIFFLMTTTDDGIHVDKIIKQ